MSPSASRSDPTETVPLLRQEPPLDRNEVTLAGRLVQPVQCRTLADGTVLHSWSLDIARPERGADTIECVSSDPAVAAVVASASVEADALLVRGRLRRRFFRANGRTVARQEVVAVAAEPLFDGR